MDDFENQFATEDDVDSDIEPENPIVKEVARLINEYTNRFDEIIAEAGDEGDLPEEIFEYEPEIIMNVSLMKFLWTPCMIPCRKPMILNNNPHTPITGGFSYEYREYRFY